MFWTHDFDHMSLIYDIVNTFCLAHNEESQTIILFQPFHLFEYYYVQPLLLLDTTSLSEFDPRSG